MIALVFAVALFVPGPNDPVCLPGQSVQVDHCAQGQLPGETIGRQIGNGSAPASTPVARVSPAPAPTTVPTVTELAYTGVPVAPYLATAGLLIGAGLVMRRVASR